MVDVFSQWTEQRAVRTKAQALVFAQLQSARGDLPFPLLAIHSDSGSEFINDQLYRYCRAEQLHFTRGRAGKKNDNPRVDWTSVQWAILGGIICSPPRTFRSVCLSAL